jgi:uncharacterized protein (DUF2141 family)
MYTATNDRPRTRASWSFDAVTRKLTTAAASLAALGMATAAPALAQYRQEIGNDLSRCAGDGPAVMVTVADVKASSGTIRVQSYRGTAGDWLKKGRWLSRIESPARRGTMTFCVPVPTAGSYGIAVRHDVNGNGKSDLTQDGGGMSNNPSINIFNLGKPGIDRTAVQVGDGVRTVRIVMRYM